MRVSDTVGNSNLTEYGPDLRFLKDNYEASKLDIRLSETTPSYNLMFLVLTRALCHLAIK